MNMYLHRKHTFVPMGLWDIRGSRLQVFNKILLVHFCVSNSHEKIYKRHLYDSFALTSMYCDILHVLLL